MVGHIILWVIIALILFILLVPIGADVNYENGELAVSAKVWKILIKLLPKAPPDPNKPPKEKKPKKPKPIKKKKPKKPKKPKEKSEGEAKPKKKFKLDFTLEEITSLLKKVFSGVGKLFRIRVERFMLHYTAGGGDPYDTAKTFGTVNAVLSALAPICAKKYKSCEADVRTDIDFTLDKAQIDGGIAFTIRLWNVFAAVNTIIFGALGILIKHKLRLFFEKRRNKKNAPAPNDGENEPKNEEHKEIIKETVQAEERTE